MASMNKRLDALEQIAQEVEQRPWRALAVKRGVPPDEFVVGVERIGERMQQMELAGMGIRQIVEVLAAEAGATVTEFEAEIEQVMRDLDDR